MEQVHEVQCTGEDRREETVSVESRPSPFDSLPEECISMIVSFTSPRDACVISSVSKTCNLAMKSDIVWEKFLPSGYSSIAPQSQDFTSKKELYFDLCDNPFLNEDGTKSLWLDKTSGKKCVMLSAMNFYIVDFDYYCLWIQIPESRFERVAELVRVLWLEFHCRVNTSLLSPKTHYSAYIVFKKKSNCAGYTDVVIETEVGVVGQESSKRFICFDPSMDTDDEQNVKPKEREDGWMEIEIGDFFDEGGLLNTDEIEMSVYETKGDNWKIGLIVQGIEIRPTKIM